jgi:hypothetical protein
MGTLFLFKKQEKRWVRAAFGARSQQSEVSNRVPTAILNVLG